MSEKGKEIVSQVDVLLKRLDADKPKPEDVKAFRELLASFPDLWRAVGDLAVQAQHGIIQDTKMPTAMRESLKFGILQLEKDLRVKGDGVLEGLLIEQVILSWLRLNTTEHAYSSRMRESVSLGVGKYWDGHLAQAQGRYLRACEALARVRRLSRPSAMQVNIGEKQVNVAQGAQPKQIGESAPSVEGKESKGNA